MQGRHLNRKNAAGPVIVMERGQRYLNPILARGAEAQMHRSAEAQRHRRRVDELSAASSDRVFPLETSFATILHYLKLGLGLWLSCGGSGGSGSAEQPVGMARELWIQTRVLLN